MLLSIVSPLIQVKQHLIGSLFYEVGCINCLQNFNSILVVSTVPREVKNTQYFIIVKWGTNTGNILKTRVSRGHIDEFFLWIKAKYIF